MSRQLEFGIVQHLLHNAKSEAKSAEDLGFDYLVTGEHLMFHGSISNNIVALSVAAGATDNIKLLSGIILAPVYPPVLLAKQCATLDVVSGGRFSLGVGVGGEFPPEFEAVGVPVTERGARTDEALEVLQLLLESGRSGPVSFSGNFTSFTDFAIRPSPVQSRLPVWVAGRREAAMRRAARFADVWMPYMYTPEMLADSLATIDGHRQAFRSSPPEKTGTSTQTLTKTIDGSIYIFACVHEDQSMALKMAADQLSKQYNQDFTKLVSKYTLSGSPETCVARARQYIDAGARTIIFASACPADYAPTNVRLIAEGIVEPLRRTTNQVKR